MNITELVELSWPWPVVVGHRGSASTHPENTIASFQEAYRVGAQMVECDVHMSGDGDVIVIHDDTLDRTTELFGPVSSISTRELVAAGIPLLSDVLELEKPVIIEIKSGRGISQALMRELEHHGALHRTVIFGFNRVHLEEVRALNASQFTARLLTRPEIEIEALLRNLAEYRIDGLALNHWSITENVANHCRAARVPLFAWTVPPGDEVTRLHGLGVNFIITDHPQLVVAQLSG